MAEKPTDHSPSNGNVLISNSSVSDVTTTDTPAEVPPPPHRDTLSYVVTQEEDSHPISSLEPTIEYQPDHLNLLASLTDDGLEDTPATGQLPDERNMYGGFFDDNIYPRSNGGHTANTGHRMPVQSQQMEPTSFMERQFTSPYPYRWWCDSGRNYLEEQSQMNAPTFHSSSLYQGLREPMTSTVSDYAPYVNTSTFMLEEPHSALTATMTYADVPRIKLQTYYGMSSRQAPRSYVYPLVGQSHSTPPPPTPPPPPYGAYHSTMMHNAASSGGYPTHHSHCSMDMGINICSSDYSHAVASPATNSQDLQSHYHQRSSVATGIANRLQNILGDSSSKEQCQSFSTDHYPSTSTTASTTRPSSSLVQVYPPTHSELSDSQLWLNNYRSVVPNCGNAVTSNYPYPPPSSSKEYQRASGALQSNYFTSKETFDRNVDSAHSTKAPCASSQDALGCRANNMLASVLDRLESANCLLDLSKQNEAVISRSFPDGCVAGRTTNVVDTPITATFTQASPATVVSCGMRPPDLTNPSHNTSSPLQTLPSFSSQFGSSCSSCFDPKKRKTSTVREMLQSKKKIMALMQPTATTKTTSLVTNKQTNEQMSVSTNFNDVSKHGTYPIPSSKPTMSTAALELPRFKNPPPYHMPEIRFPVPVSNRKPAPLRAQPIPIVFLQNLPPLTSSDKQMVTNWHILLQSPSVHQDASNTSVETSSVVARSVPPAPRHSLLREALSGGLRTYGATNSSPVATAISMPILVPNEKETECVKSVLRSNKPLSSQVVPSKTTTPSTSKPVVKIDSLNFRPQHYEMDFLQIGSFVVTNSPGSKNINKFKILFAKRKFVYEFQVVNIGLPDHDRSIQHIATIDVPFNIINAIHCNDQEILIAVTQTPDLFLFCKRGKSNAVGCESHYERGRKTDITGGTLRTNHLHKIYLRKCRAEVLRATFETFDASFKIKMQTPILEVVEIGNLVGTPGKDDPQVKRQRVVEVIQPLEPLVASTPKEINAVPVRSFCHCQVSCRSNRCSCMKAKIKCGRGFPGCSCRNCSNPLNVLDSMGFCTDDCAADICLVHNIVSYKGDLKELLERKAKFPCCDTEVPVRECIPGKVRCPNESCNGLYKFSWCDFELQDEEKEPRNHCSMCRSCQGCVDLHCNSCRRCNPMKTNGSKCPDCDNIRDTTFTEIRDIANVLLLLANAVDRTEDENEADGDHEERVLDPRSFNVEVVNIDDSEDIEMVGLRAPDAINEVEVEGESSSDRENDDSNPAVTSEESVNVDEESPATSTCVEDKTQD